jgi:drug/metabolite transporter (DMT)-like permease
MLCGVSKFSQRDVLKSSVSIMGGGEWWSLLLHGQVISIFLAGTGIFANELSSLDPNSNFPVLMAFLTYCLCSTYLVRPLIRRACCGVHEYGLAESDAEVRTMKAAGDGQTYGRTNRSPGGARGQGAGGNMGFDPRTAALPAPGEALPSVWWYVFGAFLDLEANFLVISAFNYTSITSIALLDCFTIPSAMILSYFFLDSRYVLRHYMGVIICILGVVCIVVSDRYADEESAASEQAFVGDMICIGGAFLYACSNVLQEKLVKYSEREVYVGRIGGFGMCMAALQFLAIEYTRFDRVSPLSPDAGLFILGFVVCLFFFYTNVSAFLQSNDSIIFNLSLLTSDVYTVIYSYFKVGHWVSWLYIVAFALVAIGLLLYHSASSPQGEMGVNNSPRDIPDGDDRLESAREELEDAFSYNPLSERGDTEESEHPEYTF